VGRDTLKKDILAGIREENGKTGALRPVRGAAAKQVGSILVSTNAGHIPDGILLPDRNVSRL